MKAHRLFADVGSHGGIFYFDLGNIADKYPGLCQIYRTKLTEDLVPVLVIGKDIVDDIASRLRSHDYACRMANGGDRCTCGLKKILNILEKLK